MKIRTLLIDNDETTVRLIALIARERGHEVIVCPHPDACHAYADDRTCPNESACCDLLITGDLPHLSGLDVIERQLQGGCKGAVRGKAALSRTWTSDDLARAERIGCKVFKKPFLVREINDWMEEREEEIAARTPAAG